jgi:hypothetical protein
MQNLLHLLNAPPPIAHPFAAPFPRTPNAHPCPLDTFELHLHLPFGCKTQSGLNQLTRLVSPLLRRCPHHITYKTLPIPAVFADALSVLRQFKRSLASGFVLGRRPPLQCILLVGGGQRVQTLLENAAPRPQYPAQFGLVEVARARELRRLDQIVPRLAQHLVPLGVLQPRIHLDGGHVFQCAQSPLLPFGLPILDLLDDLVFDFVLAVPCITPAVRDRLGIPGCFFANVLNCGSAGPALLRDLLALVHGPIPLPLLPKPRLQPCCLEHLLVGHPLLVVGLVPMLPHGLPAHRLLGAVPTHKPVDHGDNGLWRHPAQGQWDAGAGVRIREPFDVLLDLLPQLNGRLVLV